MSVTAAGGFGAAGLACGIKDSGALDLALVTTLDRTPAAAAAVFTRNRMTAAPVLVSRAHLGASGGRATAVVLNSGCANAATGTDGEHDAERMCALAAVELGCEPEHVLVCSTGLIGPRLPMANIEAAMPGLVKTCEPGPKAGAAAAEAIRTTDTCRKESDRRASGGFVVGGMAKGAAMLAPDMATMLAVLTTDALVEPACLDRVLRSAVEQSFNAITVDGCCSTNDTVVLLASGAAGAASEGELTESVIEVCSDLAMQMVADAEGHTKVVRVRVTGASSFDDARRGARAVAESQLTKCSWYGSDPYWGRIASDLGSSGIEFDAERLSIAYGDIVVAERGAAANHDSSALAVYMKGDHIDVTADLGVGHGEAVLFTNDLSHGYVDENMRTS
jgi:glutamate N-acetyltransferase/amino-acid N-acetyltransferase